MPTQHAQYEELCALAVSAQIAPDELRQLNEHMQTCADCRDRLADYGQILGEALPEMSVQGEFATAPDGMLDRFIARAHSEGVPLTSLKSESGSSKSARLLRRCLYFAPALAAGAAAFLVIINHRVLQRDLRIHQEASHAPDPLPSRGNDQPGGLLETNKELSQQLNSLGARVSELTADLSLKKRDLEMGQSQLVQAQARLAALERQKQDLSQGIADRDRKIADLEVESSKARSELETQASLERANEFLVKKDADDLEGLRRQVDSLMDRLSESEQLSAAANQAKDLIVARHLHIVDVDDTDGAGRRERPFGRIFYAEGKNLVFYAYDLSDPKKLNANINFYVWGGREGLNKPAHSLGIFRADDAKERRWVLKFDDPAILAEINCVWVTAEPGKKLVNQPTGKQILFASLGRANHP